MPPICPANSFCPHVWSPSVIASAPASKTSLASAAVMPDGDRSFYTNLPHGRNYYDYVAKELPKIMETMFPLISSAREDRFIAGNSMGGYGALKIALREDGAFAAAAPLSF